MLRNTIVGIGGGMRLAFLPIFDRDPDSITIQTSTTEERPNEFRTGYERVVDIFRPKYIVHNYSDLSVWVLWFISDSFICAVSTMLSAPNWMLSIKPDLWVCFAAAFGAVFSNHGSPLWIIWRTIKQRSFEITWKQSVIWIERWHWASAEDSIDGAGEWHYGAHHLCRALINLLIHIFRIHCNYSLTFRGIITIMSTYRDKSSILDYVVAGTTTGAIYKINLGLRGMVSGGKVYSFLHALKFGESCVSEKCNKSLFNAGFFGCLLGTVCGCCALTILKCTGHSMRDVRYFQYGWREARDKAIHATYKVRGAPSGSVQQFEICSSFVFFNRPKKRPK